MSRGQGGSQAEEEEDVEVEPFGGPKVSKPNLRNYDDPHEHWSQDGGSSRAAPPQQEERQKASTYKGQSII